MLNYFAHNTGTPHVPHDGIGLLLLIAAIATIMLIAFWFSSAKQTKKLPEDEE